jgi:hypothetical protein
MLGNNNTGAPPVCKTSRCIEGMKYEEGIYIGRAYKDVSMNPKETAHMSDLDTATFTGEI